jgi:hypothetical protein
MGRRGLAGFGGPGMSLSIETKTEEKDLRVTKKAHEQYIKNLPFLF